MAFTLNEEQIMLQDSARRFFQDKMPITHLRHLRDQKDKLALDPKLWKEMGQMGLNGTLISEDYGGTDFGVLGLCLIFEEAGRVLAPSPLFSTALCAATMIALGASSSQKEALLPQIANGDIIIALALDEGAHHAPNTISARAKKTSQGYHLSGQKKFVIDGAVADKIIFVAKIEGSAHKSLFLIDGQDAKRVQLDLADSRNYANIEVKDLLVKEEHIIGGVDGGDKILEPVLDLGRIAIASEMLGMVREVFERIIEHLKERKQFDQTIGSFQALKHRAAQMFCEIELCHSATREAAFAADQRANHLPLLASLAKARLCDCTRLVTNEGVQMFGGMGMTDELDMGLFMKRARVQAQILGDGGFHLNRFATLEAY